MTISLRTNKTENESQSFDFTDADFQMIAKIANSHYGLHLQESKKALVNSRLTRRLKKLNLNSFSEYCDLLQTPNGKSEHPQFLTALTTNVTQFFRENHHFTQIYELCLPTLLKENTHRSEFRIWSAACSTGQEAFCLAATVRQFCRHNEQLNFKILATDVDPNVLETAGQAEYPIDQLHAIEPNQRHIMIDGSYDSTTKFKMKDDIRDLVTFRQLNLMDNWPMKRQFDIIMCRNAAIYFDKSTQQNLWNRFANVLSPGGYLMIGHSERVTGEATNLFRSIGVTAYQKIK